MRRISILLFTLVTFLVAAAWPQAEAPKKEPTIITFDPPGSIFTEALDINPAGAIVGTYADASNVNHGFLRAKEGSITTFDVPGAIGTVAWSINPAGAIAGFYLDASVVLHGFLRAKKGTFTTFDAPGAGTGTGQGTTTSTVDGLNPEGAIAAGYVSEGGVFSGTQVGHGAVRAADGTITEFDVPGAGTGAFQGTYPFQNNSADAITGYYIDSSNVFHGFVRK